MAKNKETTMEKVSQPDAALTRPDFIPEGKSGREHIHKDDIQIPRLLLAQKGSPQVEDGNAAFIDDLKPGHMFNGLTQGNYGRGPLEFQILRGDPPRWVEFIPRDEGGGIKDKNVPANDPRTQWGPGGEKPVATMFYDYIIRLLPSNELIALSFKSTGIRVAKQLNALIQLRNADIYAGKYKLTSVDAQNQHGRFAVFAIANAGWVTKEQFEEAAELHNGLKDRDLNVQPPTDEPEPGEPGEPGDTEFPHGSNVGM